MTPPIRETVHIAAGWDITQDYTLREAIEWYKSALTALGTLGPLTAMEVAHINKSWVDMAYTISSKQGVPAGSLSYYLAELATTEMSLTEQVIADSQAAGL